MLITTIYCQLDDFYKLFEESFKLKCLPKSNKGRKSKLTIPEIATILVLFHLSGYQNLKRFYNDYVSVHLKSYFPDLVSYNRFVELIPSSIIFLKAFLKFAPTKRPSFIAFIDSTKLPVCENRRIKSHKVFKGIAKRGKDSTGWFYGFKLHMIVSDKGEILSFDITAGNVDDRKPVKKMVEELKEKVIKIYGDKGYISEELSEEILSRGIEFITRIRKNMEGRVMRKIDEIISKKRALIETVNGILKKQIKIDHTRHRSPINFLANVLSGLVAYYFRDKKPSINLNLYFSSTSIVLL